MPHPSPIRRGDVSVADLLSAVDAGATCAVAGQVQRDLARCAGRFPDLFPARPFDGAFFSTIALANTFCAPWLTADGLRAANRITMWIFGVDRLIDYLATTPEEVDAVVARCLPVAAGAPPEPGDQVGAFLAEIRDDLSGAPSYPLLREVWVDEVRRMVESMAREWRWCAARQADPHAPAPTLDAYLDNAEFGFALVYVSHWIATEPPVEPTAVDPLRRAGSLVQRVVRLLNDLGTAHRDEAWGDLNALHLAGMPQVRAKLAGLVADSRAALAALRAGHPRLATFLERHVDFNTGFYGVGDYWGEL